MSAMDKQRDVEQMQPTREQLLSALDAADLGLWEVDPKTGSWTCRSLRHDQLLGYQEPPPCWSWSMAERHMLDPDKPAFRQAVARALETGHLACEFRVRWPDGSVHWVVQRGRLHCGEAGGPARLAGVVQDVTGYRTTQGVQCCDEAYVRRGLVIKTVGVLFFRLDGRIHEANAAFERMTGYAVDELRSGPHWRGLTAPEFWDVTAQAASELAQQGETAPYEKQFIRKDGSRFWGLFSPMRLSGSGPDAECMEFIIDITATKAAEAALRQSERRLAALFESLPLGAGLVDAQGTLLLANPAMRRFMPQGVVPSRDEARRGRWHACQADGSRLPARDYPGARALRGERVLPGVEFLYTQDDGAETWVRVAAVPIEDGDGHVSGAVVVAADIDAAKRAEQALCESEERLRLAVEVGELATWDWNVATGRVVWSERHFPMEGYAVGEVEPSYESWLARVHPQDRAATEAVLRAAREGREPYDHEFRVLHPDGSVHWLSAQGHFFYDAQGQACRMLGVMRDVTLQRAAREQLEHQVRERTHALRQLLQRLETVQDEERQRIARELHDTLGQLLSALQLSVAAARAQLHGSHPSLAGQFDKLQQLIETVDRELDRIVFTLRPTALEDSGLGDAIAAHVGTWSELTGQAVDLLVAGLEERRLPPRVEAAVFRVVQEALNNIAKHARAARVSVSIECLGRQLVASIEDDGVGFDTEAAEPAGGRPSWGLLGMRERIEALGGSFAIDSRPGQGTAVLLRVPLQ